LRIILDEECYQVQESLSYTAGSHTLKFGFDFSIYSIAPSFLTPQFGPTTSPIIVQYRPDAAYEMKANLTVERQIKTFLSASDTSEGGAFI